jgi:hypothetical protein
MSRTSKMVLVGFMGEQTMYIPAAQVDAAYLDTTNRGGLVGRAGLTADRRRNLRSRRLGSTLAVQRPERGKKAALATLAPEGYMIDSDTASQLSFSRTMSREEIARYNTENWTNSPVSNCRHILTLILTPDSQATTVTISSGIVCRADGYDGFFKMWGVWSRDNEREVQWMQSTLTDLRVRVEGSNQWH